MANADPHHLLQRIGHLLRAERQHLASSMGLSVAQIEALEYLSLCNRYSDTPIGVADYLGTTKGTASRSLTALEEKGLIRKRPDLVDGRVSHCEITPAGHTLLARCSTALDENLASDALEDLLRALQKRNSGRAFGVCRTCSHFQPLEVGGRCGLTKESLRPEETLQLCREFLLVVA